LGTNVTQVLNKGGTILGGRVSPAVIDPWRVQQSYVNALHPAEKAFLPLETGVYTYCPPSTDLIFFSDHTLNTGQGASACPIYVLSNDALYNKLYLTTAGVEESLACTVTWHLEFRTSSALFQIGLSGLTLESLHQAQLVLAETGYFFENPKHDAVLSKVISAAKKYVPMAVGAYNPAVGAVMKGMIKAKAKPRATIKPKTGPSKPRTTTAAASGMLPKGQKKKSKR
jgi:hypothetical protein